MIYHLGGELALLQYCGEHSPEFLNPNSQGTQLLIQDSLKTEVYDKGKVQPVYLPPSSLEIHRIAQPKLSSGQDKGGCRGCAITYFQEQSWLLEVVGYTRIISTEKG